MAFVAALANMDWCSAQRRELDDAVLFARSRAKIAPEREAMVFFVWRYKGRITPFAFVTDQGACQLALAFPPYCMVGEVRTRPPEPATPTAWERPGVEQLALPFPARDGSP